MSKVLITENLPGNKVYDNRQGQIVIDKDIITELEKENPEYIEGIKWYTMGELVDTNRFDNETNELLGKVGKTKTIKVPENSIYGTWINKG